MMRSCFAALLVLGGLAATANAQVYTTYYGPSYAPSAYTAGLPGPLRVFDWRWWVGAVPYSADYAYPGTAYTAGYAPTAYTAAYGPSVYTAGYTPAVWSANYYSTSYYTPFLDTAIAYYPGSYVMAPGACCTPCAGAINPSCPGGNCGMNYQPIPADGPQPAPSSNPTFSGSQRYESQSPVAPGTGVPPNEAVPMGNDPTGQTPPGGNNWRRYDRQDGGNAPPANDGFEGIESGANYGPPERIDQRAPIGGGDSQPDPPENEAAPAEEAPEATDGPAAEADLFRAPIPDPEAAMPVVNRDSRISNAPSVLPERRRMSARFGSPEVARAHVNPENVPSAEDLKLVRK